MSELDDLTRRVQELEVENRRLKQEHVAYRSRVEAELSDLERSHDITLETLSHALDLQQAEPAGHSKRVAAFTIAITQKMCLPKDEIRVIARGAILHDIGKMSIPDNILRKPGKLTPEELGIMKKHPLYGYKILRNIPFLNEAAEIVYSHQERFDGTGYPRGLKGKEIPLGARIVAVANTLAVITSDRPYRARLSLRAAFREIELWSGRQFDPRIVEVLLSMPHDLWQFLEGDTD